MTVIETLSRAVTTTEALHRLGEHFAAGYMACPDEPPVVRFAMGVAAHLEHVDLPPYQGEPLYPCAGSLYARGAAVEWHYSSCLGYNPEVLRTKLAHTDDRTEQAALEAVHGALRDYPHFGGYTHSIPNYRRILHEGLGSYAGRIARSRELAQRRGEQERVDFCRAMEIVLASIEPLQQRMAAQVRAAEVEGPEVQGTQQRLAAALEHVPTAPARGFYEAMVAENFVLYLDGPDDLGRFDQDLWPYFERDREAGRVTDDQARQWVRQLWRNIDLNCAWNVALGGLLEDGTSGITDLTRICVEAAHSMRRPNLALRLHDGCREDIWDAALDCIFSGGGIPALYNEDAYVSAIRDAHLGVGEHDLPDFAFGGCTELMVHGKSNVGSLEGDVNLPQVLVQTLQSSLPSCASFEQLLGAYKRDMAQHISDATDAWNANQSGKAKWQPQVVRSLLIDDCIDNAREYNEGGARYNWCVVNVMGLANVIDSLAAVREVVFERGEVAAADLLAALSGDFEGAESLRKRLAQCPRFGNDNPHADDLAEDVSEFVFSELRRYAPWRGGRYIPACLMFTTYAFFGKPVGATPDGRKASMPIADSAGAMQGRDISGPTALMRSVTRIKHHLAPGTLVVNVRFAKSLFAADSARAKLKELVRSYFELGGMQIQINVVDQKVLEDAYRHPEDYGDLIIRLGGYSEFWMHLDDDLRRSVLERVEHE